MNIWNKTHRKLFVGLHTSQKNFYMILESTLMLNISMHAVALRLLLSNMPKTAPDQKYPMYTYIHAHDKKCSNFPLSLWDEDRPVQGTLSSVPSGVVGLPGELDASLALQPPSPSVCGTWHESVGCCLYPAAPVPGLVKRIHMLTQLWLLDAHLVFFLKWSSPSVSCRRELQPTSPQSLGFSMWRRMSSFLASAWSAHTSLAFLLLFWTAVTPVKIGTSLEYMTS